STRPLGSNVQSCSCPSTQAAAELTPPGITENAITRRCWARRPAVIRKVSIMATLFKPVRPYPLPSDPQIVHRDGKPHVRVKDRGKSAYYPLSEDGTQFLKPAAKWAADVRFADGKRRRVRFSPNRDAAALMLAALLKKIEREKAGDVDRYAEH